MSSDRKPTRTELEEMVEAQARDILRLQQDLSIRTTELNAAQDALKAQRSKQRRERKVIDDQIENLNKELKALRNGTARTT